MAKRSDEKIAAAMIAGGGLMLFRAVKKRVTAPFKPPQKKAARFSFVLKRKEKPRPWWKRIFK